MILTSNTLGAKLARNPFMLASATDNNALFADSFSNVIGLTSISDLNVDIEFDFASVNKKHVFTNACPLEGFDWSVAPLFNSFNIASAFTVEIGIEFYTVCRC